MAHEIALIGTSSYSIYACALDRCYLESNGGSWNPGRETHDGNGTKENHFNGTKFLCSS